MSKGRSAAVLRRCKSLGILCAFALGIFSAAAYAQVPAAPTLVSPANGATNVPQNVVLTWAPATGATAYNVYFGYTSPPPGAFINTTATSYAPVVAPGETYYWQVQSRNSSGTTSSQTWSFTVAGVAQPPAASTLSSPPNGATGISQIPTLSWNAAAGALSYDIYLGTSPTPSYATYTDTTYYTPFVSLTAGTVYYWQIVAKNGTGSTASAIWSFTVAGSGAQPPSAPTLSFPSNNATGIGLNPKLSWGGALGETSFDVYFGTSPTPPFAANTALPNFSPATLTSGTVYYWQVVAKNANGNTSSPVWSFTVTPGQPPSAPVLLSPGNNTTASQYVVLNWSDVGAGTSYDVFLSTLSSPTQVATTTGTSYDSYNSGKPLLPGVYYWGVRARNGSGSASSAIWSFTVTGVSQPPAAPTLVSPANGLSGVPLNPTLTWNSAAGAASYDVYYYMSGMSANVGSTTGTSFSPGNLTVGAVYYWQVFARNGAGSAFSPIWSFTVAGGGQTPGVPILTSPANGATDVPRQSPTLSWNAAIGATSYDVFFGNSPTPSHVTTTTGTTYTPFLLTAGAVYYWQVVASNGSGTAGSAVWSFTVAEDPGGGPPAAPVLISPLPGGSGVSQTPRLNWTPASGASSYDLYFGSSSTPPFLVNTTITNYSTGNLAAGGVYYWRVVAKNAFGSASSTTSSFTVTSAGPVLGIPVLVSPVNGATGVPLIPILSWNTANSATSYDVYFGNSPTPPLVTNTTVTSFTPGSLPPGGIYYWQVVAKNAAATAGSPVWSFTTTSSAVGPTISLVANAFGDTPVIAPNTWIEIKGTNLAPAGDTRIWAASDFVNNQLPTQLDGVGVTVNGKNAYVYYISPTQINILTPPDALPVPTQVQVINNGVTSNVAAVQAQPQSLSFFEFVLSGGLHYVYGRHGSDGSLIGPTTLFPGSSTPVKPGEPIYIAATGFGTTDVPIVSGALTQSGNLPTPFPVVKIGGVQANVSFAGLVAVGTYQINFAVPNNVPDGDLPLTATYNGLSIQPNLLITVQH